MVTSRWIVCPKWVMFLVLCSALGLAGPVRAADAAELWPELSAYVGLNERARLYLDASYARSKESDLKSLDVSGFVDLSIKPILRSDLWSDDWQRKRYLFARLGYTRVFKATADGTEVAENRGSVALFARAPLPAEVWLESRVRADLRWIGGDYSTRYRARLEVNREWAVGEHSVLPYINVEAFYDTRYDAWARTLYQGGVEVTVDKRFRYEIVLVRQVDRLPAPESLNALSLVAKWYF